MKKTQLKISTESLRLNPAMGERRVNSTTLNTEAGRNSESGIVLILFALIVFVAMIILAMVVDHSKQSLALNTLQRAADVAALSGAKRFNGKHEGWKNAKLAAIATIKQNPIHGIQNSELQTLALTEGPARYDDQNSPHPGSIGETNNLTAKIERGVLWFDYKLKGPASTEYPKGTPGGYRFISLESKKASEGFPIPHGIKGYVYSNAVRVTLHLNSLATTFGRILGISEFRDLERSAIAVTHEELELPVAPIAIPLCALQLNTDPYATGNQHTTKDIDLYKQCTRQGIATEADPLRELPEVFGAVDKLQKQDEILRRREGFTRFSTYPRPVYAKYEASKGPSSCFDSPIDGYAHNCKNVLLNGVMGIPSFEPGNEADAKDVAKAFTQGTKARIGMFFAPLTNLRDFASNPSYRSAVADIINDSASYNKHNQSLSFQNAFTSAEGETLRKANRNFPAIRTKRPPAGVFDPEQRPPVAASGTLDPSVYDLGITWPTQYFTASKAPAIEKLLMDVQKGATTREPLDYSIATCHDPQIPIDTLNSSQPDRHKVRVMLAPVIAPGTQVKPDGKPAIYCDYQEVFDDYDKTGEATTVAPVPKSLPVIVGFVRVMIYDFNLQDLDQVAAFKPTGANAVGPFGPEVLAGQTGAVLPPNAWASVSSPYYSDPISGKKILDRHSGELDVTSSFIAQESLDKINQYEQDHGQWEQCVNDTKSSCEHGRPKPKGGKFLGIPFEFLRCFDFREVFFNPLFSQISGGNVVEAVQKIDPDACAEMTALGTTTTYACVKKDGEAEKLKNEYFNRLKRFFGKNIKSSEFTHCLPREDLQDNIETNNKNNPDYYVRPLDTTRLGHGCGGILFRTDCGVDPNRSRTLECDENNGTCENTFFLAGGVEWSDTSPAIVKEDLEESD